MGEAFSDELCENGPIGRVLGDGIENMCFNDGVFVDADKFCEEVIGGSAFVDNGHEAEVGNILHWSQR